MIFMGSLLARFRISCSKREKNIGPHKQDEDKSWKPISNQTKRRALDDLVVPAGGTPLIPRNLLILQDGRNYKNIEFTEVRYTAGTRQTLS
jgi:hypothetical protein